MPDPSFFIIAGVGAIAIWIASLFINDATGVFILEYGWIAPFMAFEPNSYLGIPASLGWYANIPFIILVICLLLGRKPNFVLSTVAFCLALAGLLPIPFPNMRDGSTNWESMAFSLTGCLWVASFAIIWLIAYYTKNISYEPE